MKILLWGISIPALSFILNLIIWIIFSVKKRIITLFIIYPGVLAIFLIFSWIAQLFKTKIPLPANFLEYIYICLFVFSMDLAYILTYVPIEVDSPSLVMIKNIASSGLKGLDESELLSKMSDERLIIPRVEDLVSAKMIYLENGKYRLTFKGNLFIKIFINFRKLIKRGVGG